MSLEQLHSYIQHIQEHADLELKQAIEAAASRQDLPAQAALAQKEGFDVSVADLEEFNASRLVELRDSDLSKAAGGLGSMALVLASDDDSTTGSKKRITM